MESLINKETRLKSQLKVLTKETQDPDFNSKPVSERQEMLRYTLVVMREYFDVLNQLIMIENAMKKY